MKKIRAGLLSFGMSGRVFHAPFLEAHPGFELAGSWERSQKSIHQYYPSAKSYSTLEDVLNDSTIELVVVNTPTHTHYEFVKKALEAGKHVIVEKAFTTTAAEAAELCSLAESKNRKLSIFQNRRWDSDFRTVKYIIESNILGDLVEVSFSYERFNPNLSPKLHKEVPGPGAGIVNDLGPHLIDQAVFLFGSPLAVFATLAVTRELSKVDDYFEILLFYPKFIARLRAGYFMKEAPASYTIHGTKGSFLKSRADIQEATLQKGVKPGGSNWGEEPAQDQGLLHTEIDGKVIREKVKTVPGDYMKYYEGMYRAIVNNESVPVSPEDGLQVMRIIEAAFQSHKERRAINL